MFGRTTLLAAVAVWSAILPVALGQSTTSTVTKKPASSSITATVKKATSTSSVPPTTQTVLVAQGAWGFNPNTVEARVGDSIVFEFMSGNHSVTRGTLEHPCIPWERYNVGKVGAFFSGFRPVDSPSTNKFWTYVVADVSEPIYWYCAAPGSCNSHLMVGIINPTNDTEINILVKNAQNSAFTLAPNENPPDENPGTETTTSAVPSASSSTIPEHPHHGLGGGAIAGIAIGAFVAVSAVGILLFYVCRKNNRKPAPVLPQQQNQDMQQSQPFIHSQQHPPQSPWTPGFPNGEQPPNYHHDPRYSNPTGTMSPMSFTHQHPGGVGMYDPKVGPPASPALTELANTQQRVSELPAGHENAIPKSPPRSPGPRSPDLG